MNSPEQRIARLERRLDRERRARGEAEQIAERTTSALYDRQRELELLETVAAAANEASTLEGALRTAIERICSYARWPVGHAYLVVPPDGRLVSSRIWHLDDPAAFERFRQASEARTFAPGEGLPGRVAVSGEPAWIVDAMNDDNFARRKDLPGGGVHGAFALPILVGTEVVAVVEIFTDRPKELNGGLLTAAAQIGILLGRVVERAQAREKIAHQGLHDALTGLPNRTLFLDRLERSLARSSRSTALTGVIFVDLDRFKAVNDTYGHETGDEVLIEVARRLDGALRPGDSIGRFGGDEFVILCEGLQHESEALLVAERLQLRLLEPFELRADSRHLVTSSAGVALGRAADTDPEGLLRDADAAMYRAKDLGRARYELFDEALRDRVLARRRTERALGRALDRGELRLHFQPIVSLPGRRVEGVEALVRWEDPERGLVPPGEFIPVAEESALILRVGEWVLGEACRQAAQWRRELGSRAPLPINVNVAARQLGQTDLSETVRRALAHAGLDARDLALEITESALMENVEHPAQTLADLRELGVRIHLDDFGTGYSSLSYLQRFPVDALKIDRSFVAPLGQRPGASAIVAAIVAMGHELSLRIVAEGIETEGQAAEALRLGCDFGQGYLFARPLTADKVRALSSSEEPGLAAQLGTGHLAPAGHE